MKEVILTYVLGLHLAPICPTIWMGWREATFQLAAGTVLAGVEWVGLAFQLLHNASFALLSCLGNCEGTKKNSYLPEMRCLALPPWMGAAAAKIQPGALQS